MVLPDDPEAFPFDLHAIPPTLSTATAAITRLDSLLHTLHRRLDDDAAAVHRAAQAVLAASKPPTRAQLQQQAALQPPRGRGRPPKRKREEQLDPAAAEMAALCGALKALGGALRADGGGGGALCVAVGEQKLGLAQLTYDAIDLHVQRADRELARMEAELKRQGLLPEAPGAGGGAAAAAAAEAAAAAAAPPPAAEPLYCVCQRVAFGDMVACDDDACSREWFHPRCVGLTRLPPAGVQWFCPECSERRAAAEAEADAAAAAAAAVAAEEAAAADKGS